MLYHLVSPHVGICLKNSIHGSMNELWKMLTEYSHIKSWETDLEMFKEIYVLKEYHQVIHWDLANDTDIKYTLTQEVNQIICEVDIITHSALPNLKCLQHYITVTQNRIKNILERVEQA